MADTIENRACQLAVYMIETGATVRNAAEKFGISKSTVHKDLSQRLPQYNALLYRQVRKVLETNKAQRHIPECASIPKQSLQTSLEYPKPESTTNPHLNAP